MLAGAGIMFHNMHSTAMHARCTCADSSACQHCHAAGALQEICQAFQRLRRPGQLNCTPPTRRSNAPMRPRHMHWTSPFKHAHAQSMLIQGTCLVSDGWHGRRGQRHIRRPLPFTVNRRRLQPASDQPAVAGDSVLSKTNTSSQNPSTRLQSACLPFDGCIRRTSTDMHATDL